MDLPDKNADSTWPRGFVKTEFCEGKKEKEICGGVYYNIYKQSLKFGDNEKWGKNIKIYEENWKKHQILLNKMNLELDQMRWFKIIKEFLELSDSIDINSPMDIIMNINYN